MARSDMQWRKADGKTALRIVVIAADKAIGYMEARNLGIEPVAVVTPRSPGAARGMIADRIMDSASLTPEQREALMPHVLPCIATIPSGAPLRAKLRSNLHDPARLTPRGYIIIVNHRDGRQTLTESVDIRLRGGEIHCGCCTPPDAETIATCPTCGSELAVTDATTTIEHGPNGQHIADQR